MAAYTQRYLSPIGEILLSANETCLTGLWFEGQKHYARGLDENRVEQETPVLRQAAEWLDIYFSGREPDFIPKLSFPLTPFQSWVWMRLLDIPYGTTTTYGELARTTSFPLRSAPVSPRAMGGALARNPISIIVPCHRVLGSDGKLTGYAGGLERKQYLLALEQGRHS